jgi:hypothetical protein
MNPISTASYLEIRTLRGCCLCEARIPGKWHGYGTPVEETNDKFLRINRDALDPCVSDGCQRSQAMPP